MAVLDNIVLEKILKEVKAGFISHDSGARRPSWWIGATTASDL